MAVNPEQGTGNTVDDAAASIEGLFGSDDEQGAEALAEADEATVAEEDSDSADFPESSEDEDSGESVEDDESDAEPTEEDDEEPEATIESLSDVAEALELPLDEVLANLKHTVKVDGESIEVTLSELQAGYQKDSDYRQKTEALKRQREQFEAEQNERIQAFESEHAQNAYILNTFEEQILHQAESDEMARLRSENPQEWSARKLELQERLQGLQRLKTEAAERYYQMQQQSVQEQQEKLSETVKQEAERLQQVIPNWGPETQQKIRTFLTDQYQYSPDQLGQVYDHRLIQMAHEAMLYRETMSKVQETTKKVKKAPRLIKPSKPKGDGALKRDSVRQLRGKLKKSGHIRDAAALLESMI